MLNVNNLPKLKQPSEIRQKMHKNRDEVVHMESNKQTLFSQTQRHAHPNHQVLRFKQIRLGHTKTHRLSSQEIPSLVTRHLNKTIIN